MNYLGSLYINNETASEARNKRIDKNETMSQQFLYRSEHTCVMKAQYMSGYENKHLYWVW